MKIHYFQRYHDKENVATANTMLLLSRLYQYSTGKFFKFLKSEFFPDSFEPELTFTLQDKSIDSVPNYLGLYSNKSVRAIEKINARILAIEINGELKNL